MKTLDDQEKEEYFEKHFPHRLTLLRTFPNRHGRIWTGEGDLYCCAKDSCLFAIRLWIDFFGLKSSDGSILIENKGRGDDVKIEAFVGKLIDVHDPLVVTHAILLSRIYKRGDKEIAHMTATFDDEYNTEEKLIRAADVIVKILKKHLYDPCGRSLPP